jgi:hypothetical protein
MLLHLQMTAPYELACYTMNDDGADDCHVCFVAWEVAAGDNICRLDGALVCISTVFTTDQENRFMRHPYHHDHGYAYARVVEAVTIDNSNDKLDDTLENHLRRHNLDFHFAIFLSQKILL